LHHGRPRKKVLVVYIDRLFKFNAAINLENTVKAINMVSKPTSIQLSLIGQLWNQLRPSKILRDKARAKQAKMEKKNGNKV